MNHNYRVFALTPYIPADYKNTPEKKMLKNYERSQYVYENNRKIDTMTEKNPAIYAYRSDIYFNPTRI
jgi:hypothetical protein